MASEKRLVDANALMDAFRSHMVERYDRNKCTWKKTARPVNPDAYGKKR